MDAVAAFGSPAKSAAPVSRVAQASLSPAGQKIVIRGVATSALSELVDTLPASKWDRQGLYWTCDATLAAAWRIVNATSCEIVSDESLQAMSRKFDDQLRPIALPARQPEVRKTDLWEHQAEAFQFADQREASLFNMWMGTGKSCVTVNCAENQQARSVLVLCPTAVRGVWRREVKKWSVSEPATLILDQKSWNVERKAKEAARFADLCELRGERFVIAINYESAMLGKFALWALSRKWDLVILDESHRIKNPDAQISKFCHKLGRVAKRRLCLSGTPLTHSPLDAYSQFKFLDPGVFGTSWPRFRDRYAITGKFGADHIVGYKNQEELSAKIALLTFTAGKEVLKNLPPITHDYLEAPLNAEARAMYDSLEQDLFARGKSGVITATNALVKLLRLQQITSGSVPVDEVDPETGATTGLRVAQHCGDEKQELLLELLASVPEDEPVVVFCKFTEDLKRIQEAAEKTGRVYGEVSGKRRDLTSDGLMPKGIGLLGVQIQSGGTGVDLTLACYVVFYSVGYSLGDYLQALERAHRPGQTRHTFVYHLLVQDTIDAVVYRALSRRKEIIDEVIDYLKAGHVLTSEAILAGMAA